MNLRNLLIFITIGIFVVGTSMACVEAKIVEKDTKSSKYHWHKATKWVGKGIIGGKHKSMKACKVAVNNYCNKKLGKGKWRATIFRDSKTNKYCAFVDVKKVVKVKHYLYKHTTVSNKNVKGMFNLKAGVIYTNYWCPKCSYMTPITH